MLVCETELRVLGGFVFSTGLGYAFRGEDPPEFIALGYLPELQFPQFEN